MKSKQFFTVLLCLFGTTFMALGLFTNSLFRPEPLRFGKNDTYDKLWKRVDSLENKGLTASALTVVDGIYAKAKTEKNAPQFVKAVIHRMKFAVVKEEFSEEKNIADLNKEVQLAEYPIKPVLQSMLAEAYWQYYQSHRWEINDHSEVIGTDLEDMATWDAKRLLRASIASYKASLENMDSLKRTKLELYDAILEKGTADARRWRPTLYDFLAHRALDFFVSTEADITEAEDQFHVNDELYLKPYSEFLKAEIKKPSDSLELKYYGLGLLQDLTRFHLNDANPEALIDLEMKRLDFIYTNSQNDHKDTLYYTTLKELASKFAANERSAELNYKVAVWFEQQSEKYQALAGTAYKDYRSKAIEVAEAAIKKFPKSYGALQCYNLVAGLQQKTVGLQLEEINAPKQPFRALVSYRSVGKLYFRILKGTPEQLETIYGPENDANARLKKILALPVAASFEQALPFDNDYNEHAAEIKLPGLEYGQYVLVGSLKPEFSLSDNLITQAPFSVSDLSVLYQRLPDGFYDVYVNHRQTGKPMKGIAVKSFEQAYNYDKRRYEKKASDTYTTNEEGYFKLKPNSDPRNNHSVFFEARNGEDVYYSRNALYRYYHPEAKKVVNKSFFFLDRAIYRPGQTVYFKGILLQDDNGTKSLRTKTKVKVEFYNANYQQTQALDLVSNEYGTVSGSFVAPADGLTGSMHISDGNGTAYFSVEEYKRPKFETEFQPVKGTFQLNDEITVNGLAKAYAGNYIDGATVNYRVIREVIRPYWWYWYKPFMPNNSATVEIINGSTTTNDTGAYSIRFKATPDLTESKASQPNYVFTIYADVVDINGETHSTTAQVNVGYVSMNLSMTVAGEMKTGALKPMTLESTNLNGEVVPAKGNIRIYQLKQPSRVYRHRQWNQPDLYTMSREEYEKNFPNDLYADEDNQYKWEKTKVAEKAFDTGAKQDYELSELNAAGPGLYLVEAITKDKNAEEVKTMQYISVFSDTQLASKDPQWFYIDKKNAEPGDTVQYILQSAYADVNYFYELEQNGKVLESGWRTASMKAMPLIIQEAYRGNVVLHTWFIRQNRFYQNTQLIDVPYTNKELDLSFETFRDKLLPGQQEEWKIRIKDKRGDKLAAEFLAGMYDASLDAFAVNSWQTDIYNRYYSNLYWSNDLGAVKNADPLYNLKSDYKTLPKREYDALNYFGMSYFNFSSGAGVSYYFSAAATPAAAPAEMDEKAVEVVTQANGNTTRKKEGAVGGIISTTADELSVDLEGGYTYKVELKGPANDKDLSAVATRSNFNETAFFFPQLQTNEQGEVIFKFTMPESLTRWKFMGWAHTKDLKTGYIEKECVTQKDLMIQPNAPRFLREGDKMSFTAKVANLSDHTVEGTAQITFVDALTGKDITALLLNNKTPQAFSLPKGQSSALSWDISIPEGFQAITYKVQAKAGNFSDGEEMALPVLTNRMLVTESMPLPIRGKQTKEFSFEKFISQNNGSTTLRNHSFTLEYTANPAWYAVQALPYLMEYPYECAEQTFSRYYANSLASKIATSNPKMKQVFDAWKTSSPDAFLSNLEKNQELKSLVAEETPWVLNAKNESERKKRVGLLFDLNRMGNELSSALRKLQKMQSSNGGWPWFENMPEDWYITQHIVSGLGHLNQLGATTTDENVEEMTRKAVLYTDARLLEQFNQLKKNAPKYKTENHLDAMAIQYLYARSYFKNIEMSDKVKEAFNYYKTQAQTYWLQNGRYMQGMIALALHRYEDTKTPKAILKSLKENAIVSEEMGMYWKENYNGFYWYESPIESQALLIEAFDLINQDVQTVNDLKTWLLKSKQTQDWKTTKATSEAIYALLLRGTDWLSTEPAVEISVGGVKIDPKKDESIKVEAGTGYFKKTWTGSDIKPAMGKIKVQKKDEGVSWGAVYWQYFEQLDKITPHETPLKIKKGLFLQKNTASGPVLEPITTASALKPGDKVKVRIELRVDRDMEYVHMKDMRASGFEPTNVFSGYRYEGGLGYYESTRDASTNFFFSYLNKGTHVFEYTLVVSQYGNFSNGVTTIQCMYAPEFTSHSEGIRVNIQK